MPSPDLSPIYKSIRVSWTPEQAFDRFTQQLGTWWPLGSHSVGQGDAETVTMDPRVGGEIVERLRGGKEAHWGTVLEWEPPNRVAFTWHPGRDAAQGTRVEVRFTPDAGTTRVDLIHSNWAALGDLASTARRGYPIGWAYVLRLYADRRHSPVVVGMDALQWLLQPLTRRMARKAGPMRVREARAG
jgi:uncharacterized protein YndB with AHSA1/START domain